MSHLIAYVAPASSFVQAENGQVTTTSRRVAEFFGKQHAHVMRVIREMDCSDEFRRSNYGESSYRNAQNKEQPMFTLTRDGFMFLAMGFTGPKAAQIKEAYIAAWNQMERELKARETDTTARLQRELINAQKRAVKAERGWRVALQAQLRLAQRAAAALMPKPKQDNVSLSLPGFN